MSRQYTKEEALEYINSMKRDLPYLNDVIEAFEDYEYIAEDNILATIKSLTGLLDKISLKSSGYSTAVYGGGIDALASNVTRYVEYLRNLTEKTIATNINKSLASTVYKYTLLNYIKLYSALIVGNSEDAISLSDAIQTLAKEIETDKQLGESVEALKEASGNIMDFIREQDLEDIIEGNISLRAIIGDDFEYDLGDGYIPADTPAHSALWSKSADDDEDEMAGVEDIGNEYLSTDDFISL